jgi:hypothetical protein
VFTRIVNHCSTVKQTNWSDGSAPPLSGPTKSSQINPDSKHEPNVLEKPHHTQKLSRLGGHCLFGACAWESGFVKHLCLRFRISCPKAITVAAPWQADLTPERRGGGLACAFY